MSVNQATDAAQNTPNAADAAQAPAQQAQKDTASTTTTLGGAAQASPQDGKAGATEGAKEQSADTTKQNPDGKQTVVPEKYDLKLPEGSLLDAKAIEEISSFAKEKGLSNEQAQAILERENGAVSNFASKQQQDLKEKPTAWLSEAQSDKEIGGEAFAKNAEVAKRVVDKFGSEAFKKTLNDTGLGNHPELVRVFYRIGKMMSDDQFIVPGAQTGAKKSIEDVFYGKKDE